MELKLDISDRYIPVTLSNISAGNGQQLRSENTASKTPNGSGPGTSAVKFPAVNMGKSPVRG